MHQSALKQKMPINITAGIMQLKLAFRESCRTLLIHHVGNATNNEGALIGDLRLGFSDIIPDLFLFIVPSSELVSRDSFLPI